MDRALTSKPRNVGAGCTDPRDRQDRQEGQQGCAGQPSPGGATPTTSRSPVRVLGAAVAVVRRAEGGHHAPWLFFFALVIVVFLAGKYRPSRVTAADLNALLLDNNVIPGDPISLFGSIEWALAGTNFEHRWNVNSPYDDSSLNIYLIDSVDPRLATHRHIRMFSKNAVFLQRLNTIVVDYQFIEILGNRYFTSDLDMGARSILLNWIVAHEIGHLMSGHGTSHFALNDMLDRKRRSSANQIREDEADQYFADVIRATSQDAVDTFVSVFVQIVEHEANLMPEQGSTGNQPPSHPTYLSRAFRFLQRLVDREKDRELADLIEGWGRELGLQ